LPADAIGRLLRDAMKFLKVVAWIVGILAVLGGVLYAVAFDVWTVPAEDAMLAASIEPALRAGDVILVSRRLADEQRGHLVRCSDPRPTSPGGFVVGRVLARPGETIDFQSDVVSVDQRRNPSPYACEPKTMKHPETDEDIELLCSEEDTGEIKFGAYRAKAKVGIVMTAKVEEGKVYLVSDNRYIHLDSRDYGQMDPATCQHVLFRLWSKEGFGDSAHRFNVIW
jgi:signal peptidase I